MCVVCERRGCLLMLEAAVEAVALEAVEAMAVVMEVYKDIKPGSPL